MAEDERTVTSTLDSGNINENLEKKKSNEMPQDNIGVVEKRGYPPSYPDLQRVSWSEAKKGENHIDISRIDFGYISESDSGDDTVDEFYEMPRFRGVVEWIMCLLFDVLLLLLEAAVSLWLSSSLLEEDFLAPYQAVNIVLFLPCFINPLIWLKLKSSYGLSTLFVAFMLFLGFPSPVFLYLWHLYLSMFAKRRDADKSKTLANTFRLSQAFLTSVPLVMINIAVLVEVLRVPGKEDSQLSLSQLSKHLGVVGVHDLAFVVSLCNIVRAACLYNERQTFTLLFALVAFPFLFLTVLTRIVTLGIVVAFLDPKWSAILLVSILLANVLLYVLCRKRTVTVYAGAAAANSRWRSGASVYLKPMTNSSSVDEEVSADNASCCRETGQCCCPVVAAERNKSYSYAVSGGAAGGKRCPGSLSERRSLCSDMANILMLSFCSIVVPSGYSNDAKSHHPRLKGGLFLILNFVITIVLIGIAFGYTILNKVPNTIVGVPLPKLKLTAQFPRSNIMIGLMGLDVALNLDEQRLDLSEMPEVNATFHLDTLDDTLAVVLPTILGAVLLPFVVMRASMMELDCFISRKKPLAGVERMQSYQRNKHRRHHHCEDDINVVDAGNYLEHTLVGAVAKNSENKELKFRMYTTLLCSVLGVIHMTLVFVAIGAFVYVNLFTF